MANQTDRLTDRDLATLAAVIGRDATELRADLRVRPWMVHDVLSNPDVFDAVMDRCDHPAVAVSPFLLFAVLVHRVAAELRQTAYVNDWSGPRSRLPVFDVEPLREFLEDPSRLFHLVTLLAFFTAPAPAPVPANPLDLSGLAAWLDAVLPHQRASLFLRLGDLSLFLAGVYPDSTEAAPLRPGDAVRLGSTVGMSSSEMLGLLDRARIAPSLEAMDALGSRWYSAAVESGTTPRVVGDVARRFPAARRVLNHLTDNYLYGLDLRPNAA